jgi:hypothetical protein
MEINLPQYLTHKSHPKVGHQEESQESFKCRDPTNQAIRVMVPVSYGKKSNGTVVNRPAYHGEPIIHRGHNIGRGLPEKQKVNQAKNNEAVPGNLFPASVSNLSFLISAL